MDDKKRFLIEIGTGTDLHGADVTSAAVKAIRDAMSHCCMAGLKEVLGHSAKDVSLRIKLCCPHPEKIDLEAVRAPVSFYPSVEIVAEKGGAAEKGLHVPEIADGNTIIVVIAIITVYVPD